MRQWPAMLALGAVALASLWLLALVRHAGPDGSAGDFVPLWTGAAMAVRGFGTAIWDTGTFQAFQVEELGTAYRDLPWLYPPTALMLFWPVGLLPLAAGWLVWSMAGITAWCVACRVALGRCGLGHLWWVGLTAPAVMLNLGLGQNGLFFGAALVAGLALAPSRPVLAGCLLALLAAKPQMGLMVPLALALGGHWRAFGAATGATLAFAGAATLVFGAGAWVAFIDGLAQSNLRVVGKALYILMQPTWRGSASLISAPDAVRMIATLLPPAGAAALLIWAGRGVLRTPAGLLALTPLATVCGGIYLLVYDMTAWACALIVLLPAMRGIAGRMAWWIAWALPGGVLMINLLTPGLVPMLVWLVGVLAVLCLRRTEGAQGHVTALDSGPDRTQFGAASGPDGPTGKAGP